MAIAVVACLCPANDHSLLALASAVGVLPDEVLPIPLMRPVMIKPLSQDP